MFRILWLFGTFCASVCILWPFPIFTRDVIMLWWELHYSCRSLWQYGGFAVLILSHPIILGPVILQWLLHFLSVSSIFIVSSFICLVTFSPRFFEALVNRIAFLISFSACLVLVHSKGVEFLCWLCILLLCWKLYLKFKSFSGGVFRDFFSVEL